MTRDMRAAAERQASVPFFVIAVVAVVLPVATGAVVVYEIWTDWGQDWSWTLKVTACIITFGAWVGIARTILWLRTLVAKAED